MKIEAPCRIGERFTCEKPWNYGRKTLTGLGFFYWKSQLNPGTTLYGKREPRNERELTSFFHPEDLVEGVRIEFEVPDSIFIPGYPLRELGMNTEASGHVSGLVLTEDSWEYYIYYGKSYGGPLGRVRTPELDKLFDPVLPLHAVKVNLSDYLI